MLERMMRYIAMLVLLGMIALSDSSPYSTFPLWTLLIAVSGWRLIK